MLKKTFRIVLITLSLVLIFIFSSAFTGIEKEEGLPENIAVKSSQLPNIPFNSNIFLPDSIINYAQELIGIRYKWGGTTTKGFDCSGFVYYVYRNFGIDLPRSSRGMAEIGSSIELEECQKGDLVLFTRPRTNRVGHVGIIISEKGEPIKFIHSSSAKNRRGVVISDLEGYYVRRFVGIRRVLVKEIQLKERFASFLASLSTSNYSNF